VVDHRDLLGKLVGFLQLLSGEQHSWAGPPPYRRPLPAAEWRTDVVDLVIATVPGVPAAARRALAGNGVVCREDTARWPGW
jgi:hypothetical protein